LLSHSRNSWHFTEPEGSPLSAQQPATAPYSEQGESIHTQTCSFNLVEKQNIQVNGADDSTHMVIENWNITNPSELTIKLNEINPQILRECGLTTMQ
jgi:hypothetical protein